MPSANGSVIQGLISLAMSIPIWALVLYYVARKDKKRDELEHKILNRIDKITMRLVSIETKIALLEQDLSYAKLTASTLATLADRIGKNEDDLNEAFSRLRTTESNDKKYARIVRVRSAWIAHSFRRLIHKYNQEHKNAQIEISPMPD